MEDTTCSPEKKRTASKAFGPSAGDGDANKEKEDEEEETFTETVTTPTVEECICFLERNKTMRQIIGLLIELEENQDDGKAMSNSHEEMVVVHREPPSACPVDEESNDDNDSVSTGNDTESCYGYNPSEERPIRNESYYENFRRKHPRVSWRDLAKAADGDDDLNKTHFGLKEHSPDEDSENDDADDDGIQTLQELAFMKVSAHFQKDSKMNEQKHTNFLASLLKQTKSDVNKVFRHYRKELKASTQLAMVSLLESLMTMAKDKLDVRTKWLYHSVNSCGIKIIRDANKHRAEIRSNWFSERQSILDDHSSFLEQYKPCDGDEDTTGNVQTKFVLCLSPHCRSLFTPHLLPAKKRCMVPDCSTTSTHPNCGCSTKPCIACRGTVCKDHLKADAHACIERARRTCGYFSDPDVSLVKHHIYCNRVFDNPVIGRCARCETRCCFDCLTFCMNCDSYDCKVCLRLGGAHMCGSDYDSDSTRGDY